MGDFVDWICCLCNQQRGAVEDLLSSLDRMNVCTGSECFEDANAALSLPATRGRVDFPFIMMLAAMALSLILVLRNMRSGAVSTRKGARGPDDHHQHMPPPEPPAVD